MAESGIEVRALEPGDQRALVSLYNHYIEHSHCTFDTTKFDVADRADWFAQFNTAPYFCLVAVDRQTIELVGFSCSVPFKPRPGYRSSVEVSIYTDAAKQTSGLGTTLYTALFAKLANQPLHRAYAGIAMPNPASIALHEKLGFRQAAYFSEVGIKFEKYWDVAWYEKPLHSVESPA